MCVYCCLYVYIYIYIYKIHMNSKWLWLNIFGPKNIAIFEWLIIASSQSHLKGVSLPGSRPIRREYSSIHLVDIGSLY